MADLGNDSDGHQILSIDNFDLRENPSKPLVRSITSNGQLMIGNVNDPNIRAGELTSPDGSITVGYDAPDITITSSESAIQTLGVKNLGMTYDDATGTATFRGADGNDLSETNPAYVTVPSNVTEGKLITTKLTSNYTFLDGNSASSVFDGSLFGFDSGDVTTNKTTGTGAETGVIFFISAILDSNDENLIFAVSPKGEYRDTVTNISNAGAGNADSAASLITLESVTIANYENVIATPAGSFRMEKTVGDDWVITDIDNARLNIWYPSDGSAKNTSAFPLGALGARADSVFRDNGGTAPTVASSSNLRYLDIPAIDAVQVNYLITLAGSPVGDVDAQLITPPKLNIGTVDLYHPQGLYITSGGSVYPITFKREASGSPLYWTLLKADGTSAKWQYSEMSAGDQIVATFIYRY